MKLLDYGVTRMTEQLILDNSFRSLEEKFNYSSTFFEHPDADELINKVAKALNYFPEITFPITLSRHGTRGAKFAIAYVDIHTGIPEINFNINYHCSMNTVFHELGHILQYFTSFDIPYGEQAASVFALARIPDSIIDSNRIPYIGLVPWYRVGDYCRMALDYRKTHRNYIKWLTIQIANDYRDGNGVFPEVDSFNEYILTDDSTIKNKINIQQTLP